MTNPRQQTAADALEVAAAHPLAARGHLLNVGKAPDASAVEHAARSRPLPDPGER